MDKSIPVAAQIILKAIYSVEAPHGYDTVYSNAQQTKAHKKVFPAVTKMTIDELIVFGREFTRRYGSSASGAAQFMRDTLIGLKNELKLTGNERMVGSFQDKLAFHLLQRRGYSKWIGGTLSNEAFANNLAKEWASFPVLTTEYRQTKSGKVKVSPGASYYAGDGMNKALVSVEFVKNMLEEAWAAYKAEVAKPKPVAEKDTVTKVTTGAATGVGTVVAIQESGVSMDQLIEWATKLMPLGLPIMLGVGAVGLGLYFYRDWRASRKAELLDQVDSNDMMEDMEAPFLAKYDQAEDEDAS